MMSASLHLETSPMDVTVRLWPAQHGGSPYSTVSVSDVTGLEGVTMYLSLAQLSELRAALDAVEVDNAGAV